MIVELIVAVVTPATSPPGSSPDPSTPPVTPPTPSSPFWEAWDAADVDADITGDRLTQRSHR